jgi:hypothetical protein
MNAPRTILLVKLSAIGDVLHGVPAAVAIKDAFPAARVGWVVEGRSADVLEGHRGIDRIFRLPRGWMKRPAEILRLARDLRAFKADVTIDMQGLLKSATVSLLAGSRIRIGHARPEARAGHQSSGRAVGRACRGEELRLACPAGDRRHVAPLRHATLAPGPDADGSLDRLARPGGPAGARQPRRRLAFEALVGRSIRRGRGAAP